MCPFCFSTIAMVVAGTVSGGGLAAIVAKKVRGHQGAESSTSQPNNQNKGEENATENRLGQ